MSPAPLAMVRVRATSLDRAELLVRQFLEVADHGHGGARLHLLSTFARRPGGDVASHRAFTALGRRLGKTLATEEDALAAAKRIRLQTQLEPHARRLGKVRLAALEAEYLDGVRFAGERQFLARALEGLPPLRLTDGLRRELYELAVAHRQHTTAKTFPFADGSAHLESCRVFDLGGRGARFYALCGVHAAH